MKRMLFLLSLAVIFSCSNDLPEEHLGENKGIIGTWVELPALEGNWTNEEGRTLERRSELHAESYGFTISENGDFLERKNAGWCGTPPITYDNFEGSWEALSDSLLQITVGYWGGVINYQMRIMDLQDELLLIRYLSVDERAEAK
jgi:hypothetical protein